MEASSTVPPPADQPTLKDVAHTQTDELYDVAALLSAIADRIDENHQHHTLRLIRMASDRVTAVIDAFNPYV